MSKGLGRESIKELEYKGNFMLEMHTPSQNPMKRWEILLLAPVCVLPTGRAMSKRWWEISDMPDREMRVWRTAKQQHDPPLSGFASSPSRAGPASFSTHIFKKPSKATAMASEAFGLLQAPKLVVHPRINFGFC
jgi:hypothetical protein